MASARMISAQRDCQLVSCLFPASHLHDQATALLLQADRPHYDRAEALSSKSASKRSAPERAWRRFEQPCPGSVFARANV